jgi:hypothetical protein
VNQLVEAVRGLAQHQAHAGGAQGSLNISPPLFFGREGEKVSTWLASVNFAFGAKQVPADRQLDTALACLRGAALEWYQKLVSDGQAPATFGDFQTRIRAAYQLPNEQYVLRQQLAALTQTGCGGRLYPYIMAFRTVVGQIQGMGLVDQALAFIRGLANADTRSDVTYHVPVDLTTAVDLAVRFEASRGRITFPLQTGREPREAAGTGPLGTAMPTGVPQAVDTGPVPMELGWREGGRNPPPGPFGRAQPRRVIGPCFSCGRQGHIQRQCFLANGQPGLRPNGVPAGPRPWPNRTQATRGGPGFGTIGRGRGGGVGRGRQFRALEVECDATEEPLEDQTDQTVDCDGPDSTDQYGDPDPAPDPHQEEDQSEQGN